MQKDARYQGPRQTGREESIVKPKREDNSVEWLEDFGIVFDQNLKPRFEGPYKSIQKDLQAYMMKLSEKELNKIMSTFLPLLLDVNILANWVASESDLKPSLLRILLNCPAFQSQVISQLGQFLEMTEFETDLLQAKKVTLKILRNLMYLDDVKDPALLTTVLLSAVEKCNDSLKELIVQNLFQIISCEESVVSRLMNMMLENVWLTPYVLEAMEGMKGFDNELDSIRSHVLNNALQAASTKDLPTVVKFLVSTTDERNAHSTVHALRTYVAVNPRQLRVDSLSTEDAYIFLITQFRHAIQINTHFLRSFLVAIEDDKEDLKILDVWMIFCMFSVTSLRNKAQQLISKVAGKTLTVSCISDAIYNHEKALMELRTSLISLMSWCLNSFEKAVIGIGLALASAMFTDFTDFETSSDIISSLITQIGLGTGDTPEQVADLLMTLSYEVPEKLQAECGIIEGILWSCDGFTESLFSKIAHVCARLTYQNEDSVAETMSQLCIGFTKMMNSIRCSTKRRGVIGMAALISRCDEIRCKNGETVVRMYESVVSSVADDINALVLFFKCLYFNKSRSDMFNDFLINTLSKHLKYVLSTKTEDAVVDFELVEQEKYLDILAFFADNQSRPRDRDVRNHIIIFTSVGLELLLDSYRLKGQNLRTCCEQLYGIGLAADFDRFSVDDTVTALMLAHSFMTAWLNFFSEPIDDSCFVRYSHLLSIEDQLVNALQGTDKYIHPIYGEMFRKHTLFFRRNKGQDRSISFFSNYRSSFLPVSAQVFNLLFCIPVPIADDDLRTVLHLVIDYLYNLHPKAASGHENLFQPPSYVSLDIAEFLSRKLLPYVVEDERPLAIDIACQVLNVLKTQVTLPVYRDKSFFLDFLKAISGYDTRTACFVYYSKMMTAELDHKIKFSLLLFLKDLLHCGPIQKIDIEGRECKLLCKLAKDLLKSNSPVLDKLEVKTILPVFFEHNSRILDDVHVFVTSVFPVDILGGDKCEDWPSLVPETFSLFFNQCFQSLNRKILEIKRRITSATFVLTEEAVASIMNRLHKVTIIMKGLLLHTCTVQIPLDVLRSVLRQGVTWTECLVSLFPFLCDAKQCEEKIVRDFLELSRCIVRQLQVIVDHVRRHEPTLHSLIPNISKALASWTYSVKSSMWAKGQQSLQILACKERTLLGEVLSADPVFDNIS